MIAKEENQSFIWTWFMFRWSDEKSWLTLEVCFVRFCNVSLYLDLVFSICHEIWTKYQYVAYIFSQNWAELNLSFLTCFKKRLVKLLYDLGLLAPHNTLENIWLNTSFFNLLYNGLIFHDIMKSLSFLSNLVCRKPTVISSVNNLLSQA